MHTKELFEFEYKDSCLVTRDEIERVGRHLLAEIVRVCDARRQGYDTEYAAINLSYDTDISLHIDTIIEQKKNLGVTTLCVIGIGGSNLGTRAIYEALHGKLHNERIVSDCRVYFADTVDSDEIAELMYRLEQELACGHEILLNVISKSGTTIETLINFELLLGMLKRYRPDTYYQYVVITTQRDSPLWHYGYEEKMTCLAIPKTIGGRYSVLSAVGLFPLAIMGIDTYSIREGACAITTSCLSNDIFDNPAALSAIICFTLYKKGFTINDTFLFSTSLEGLGKWYRQLMGESIGKAYDRDGNMVNRGITPTISIGSTDLHSVGQLYLGGPYDKYTTFVSLKNFDYGSTIIPDSLPIDLLPQELKNKSIGVVMEAIVQGAKRAYYADKRPFSSIILPEKTEYYMGQLMQMKMIEMIYLGYLLNVDPFDQPQVELYKKETREILRKM